nr:hypothetical protein CFP56_21855 [Quercus suber]
MHAEAAGVDELRAELVNGAAADEAHVHLHLVAEQLHGAVDAGLAVRTHGEEEGTADADALGAEAQRLEDVGGAAHAAVDVDFDLVVQAEPAQLRHDLGEDFDARARKVQLAPAVVGQHDAVHARLDGEQDVFDALHALEQDRHLGDGEEPGDVAPLQRRVDEGGDGARGALRPVDRVAARVLHVGPDVGELRAHVLLAPPELRRVDGDEEALAAALLGVLDDAFGDVAVLVDVELQPLHLVALLGVDDLVEGARGEGGDHLDDIVLLRGARQHDFTLGVPELAERGRGDVERNVDFGAEHGGGQVDVFHVVQDPRSEPDLVVGGVVLAHGLSRNVSTPDILTPIAARKPAGSDTHNLIVRAAGVVRPGRLLHHPSRHGLEIHEVVALLEDGHALDAFLPLQLLRVRRLLLLLDRVHVHLAQVLAPIEELVERVGRVDRLVLLRGIFAGVLEDDLGPAGMLGEELGHVVCWSREASVGGWGLAWMAGGARERPIAQT